MSPAERRCRRLLLAYPASYRAQRGDEIVSTMLDATPAGRLPRLADQVDLVASGLRRRLGTARIAGLDAGLARAAPVALALAAGISTFAWWRIEPVSAGAFMGGPPLLGAFRTLGPIAYAAWVLAAIGWAVSTRPAVRRALIGFAAAVTLALPLVAQLTTVDRPPLWVVMALGAFGLLALLGTAPAIGAIAPTTDERLAVPAGAAAVAITTSVVMSAWPPQRGAFGYYYQPTLARAGLVVTLVVAAVAVVAVLHKGRTEWLWATALLGLPAGWMGPFDSAGLLDTAPRFGRLAQVLLASCVAVAGLAWLARRRLPRLPAAGAGAAGTAMGLLGFVLLARAGHLGFAAGPVPVYVWCGIAALALAGLLARGALHSGVLVWAPVAFAAAFVVSAYDNAWTVGAWPAPGPTLMLVMTLALPPMAACAYAGLPFTRAATDPSSRPRAAGVMAVSLGWIGYVALPSVRSWGPVILILLACGVAVHLAGSRRLGRARQVL